MLPGCYTYTLMYLMGLFFRLSEEVGGLFLRASPCADMGTGLAGVRDSGYDSLSRRLSVLDRLINTHSVWLQLEFSHQNAIQILQNQAPGVRKQLILIYLNSTQQYL